MKTIFVLLLTAISINLHAQISITSSQLKREYESNEVRADANYKDKTLQVSGKVEKIGSDIMNKPYVILSRGNGFTGVQCTVKDKNSVARLNVGDVITITGKCGGKFGNILLDDCVIR